MVIVVIYVVAPYVISIHMIVCYVEDFVEHAVTVETVSYWAMVLCYGSWNARSKHFLFLFQQLELYIDPVTWNACWLVHHGNSAADLSLVQSEMSTFGYKLVGVPANNVSESVQYEFI